MLTIAYRKEFLCSEPFFTRVPSSSTSSKDHTPLDGDRAVAARWPSLSGACPGNWKSCWQRRMKLRDLRVSMPCFGCFLLWTKMFDYSSREGSQNGPKKNCQNRDRQIK